MLRKIKLRLWSMVVISGVILSLIDPGVVSAGSDSKRLTSGSVKSSSYNNPIIDHKFGADPFAMVYDGRVYVYMTNDSEQYDATSKYSNGYPTAANDYSDITTITVISSSDMVNWVDHGEISVTSAASWANNAWAPAACYKTINGVDKFFLYFADNANGIGVLQADSPIGPFTEPSTGSQLISRRSAAASGVTWLFDPAVFVDDDGTGYLYYGGGIPGSRQNNANYPGTARVVKLADNMVQLDGNAVTIDAPGLFEDSGIHKANGKYYYTYCSNFSNNLSSTGNGNICVMESNSPTGPFTFVGQVLSNPYSFFGIGGNNHHCFFNFNGETYITYHAQTVTKALGIPSGCQGYRSTHIDKVSYDSNRHINTIKGTYTGVLQTKNLDPYTLNEAETIGWSSGITTNRCWQEGSFVSSSNMKITEIHNGDWVAVSDVDLGTGPKSITVKAAPINGGTIEIRVDGRYGTKIGEINVTGSSTTWTEYTTELTAATGVHDIYFIFTGSSSGQLFYFDNWQMNGGSTSSDSTTTGNNLVVNGDIESGTSNWEGLYGCTLGLGYYTVNSGSRSLKVSNRKMTPQGAMQYISGLEKGATYKVSAAVRYNRSENSSATGNTKFYMSIIYGDGTIENMASVTTASDTWAVMDGEYTVPRNADLSSVRVFIETAYTPNPAAQDLVTFFLDDVSIAKKQTTYSGILSDGWYYIKNIHAQKYLQVTGNSGGNGVNVEIATGTGVAGQKWYLTNTGDGYITLKNGQGYMLDVQYGTNADGTNIQTYSANGADAQKFKLQKTSTDGVYGITTKASSDARGLDVYNWSTADGTNVCQWSYYGSNNQIWRFEACK